MSAPTFLFATPHGDLDVTEPELRGFAAVRAVFPAARLEHIGYRWRPAVVDQVLEQLPVEVAPVLGSRRITDVCVVLDFETADAKRDSACALGLVRVEGEQIVERRSWLIRPPRRDMVNSHIHGITWGMVHNAPVFSQVWAQAVGLFRGAQYLVAHNASFDRSVARACATASGLAMPSLPWVCTVALARHIWTHLDNHKLPSCAAHVGSKLKHHDALSDANACAEVLIAGRRQLEQWTPREFFIKLA